jgi:hypothetical protein
MISRVAAILLVLALAYFGVALIAQYLPPIDVKRLDPPKPATLQEAISLYLTHDPGDQIEMVQTNYDADWDTNPDDLHTLYELAGLVPTLGDRYASSGYQIEENYESFLLSIRPSDDPHYEQLVDDYQRVRSASAPSPPTKRKGKQALRDTRKELRDRAMNTMISYLESGHSGPTAPRLGKALKKFYGERQSAPNIKFPSGDSRNLQRINTAPDISQIHQKTINVPTIDFVVPATTIGTNAATQTAQATSLKLVELTIVRPWLDLDLLVSGPHSSWNGSPPNFFGSSGTLARIPVRIILVEEPEIEASTAKLASDASGKITVGPFTYAASEVKSDGKLLQLKPQLPHWIILAIVSKGI